VGDTYFGPTWHPLNSIVVIATAHTAVRPVVVVRIVIFVRIANLFLNVPTLKPASM
jgi:hypothetical protein